MEPEPEVEPPAASRNPGGLLLASLAVLTGAVACSPEEPAATADGGEAVEMPRSEALSSALETITPEDLAAHIRTLSSDEFEGRAPASAGEEMTLEYLESEFRELGLEPGAEDGFRQEVPLVSVTAESVTPLRLEGAGDAAGGDSDGAAEYDYGDQFMGWTRRLVDEVSLEDSELVFVGYGIVAPEYDWDDYGDLDVRDKTVVMLVNDPGFATGDEELFNGRAMTYYGRWTYKFEEAARQGASGAFVIHEPEAAGYPWEVVSGSWSGPQFDLLAADDHMGRAKVEGWLTGETARQLFDRAGLDFEELSERAAGRDFRATPLDQRASVAIENSIEYSTSHNLLALLPGAERADEYVIYTAHWDHMGRDTTLAGDQIYNGARDNASGTAALLELAEAFADLDERPDRSILFFPNTAEEQGLLGSAHYAERPVYPLENTVAVINIDGLNIWGPTEDIVAVGHGMSELDDYLAAAARIQDRRVEPDPEAEKGFYYRSDQFSFARVGVPGLYTDAGTSHREHEEGWMAERKAEWTEERYHAPSDEYAEDWDLRGAVDDIRLFFRVGQRLATGSEFPEWSEGTEFEATRDSMMAAPGQARAGGIGGGR